MGKWVVFIGICIIALTLSNMPQYTPTGGVTVTSQIVAFSAPGTTTPSGQSKPCDPPPCRSKEQVAPSGFAVAAFASAPDMELPSASKKPDKDCDPPPCRHIEPVRSI